MPSLQLENRLIWFAHCPKAGGTSVEQFMVSTFGDAVGHLHWGWDLWWRRGGWRVANPPNSPQHLVWADALNQLDTPPDLVFAVVRDPVERMASEQRWQRCGRRGTRLGKAVAFLPFALWMRLMLAVARRNLHAYDNHFRPQADFVPEEVVVFRLEDGLQPVADWLNDAAGLPPPKGVFPHAIPTKGAAMIKAETRRRIVDFFAEDYARFGYALPERMPHRRRLGLLDVLIWGLAPLVAALDRRGRL